MIFISNIWHLYGLLSDIVSDQDRYFYVSWAEVYNLLDVCRRISMPNHPETDGQTDRVNQTVK
jgi:hypothetical protein